MTFRDQLMGQPMENAPTIVLLAYQGENSSKPTETFLYEMIHFIESPDSFKTVFASILIDQNDAKISIKAVIGDDICATEESTTDRDLGLSGLKEITDSSKDFIRFFMLNENGDSAHLEADNLSIQKPGKIIAVDEEINKIKCFNGWLL
ncbi:uncharacterized protein ASCRUDRAFT_10610 [Ascoidea rubescens DSM 1968]|uniref:Uncharacterized protein n=1 Tax=Ascoidea rubescens DSM 1968 TaxID=1344418 RepID=A0A1D2V8Q4_9ASCO|nr:hypothetical protein ASCRUDRAFT_10610 [Ascoidea rubescens DSM 1968]ODV58004.1 hypothetical protein ASCRUDRAFT_10610 [Ascoidea rubescens DSM 1968]